MECEETLFSRLHEGVILPSLQLQRNISTDELHLELSIRCAVCTECMYNELKNSSLAPFWSKYIMEASEDCMFTAMQQSEAASSKMKLYAQVVTMTVANLIRIFIFTWTFLFPVHLGM